MLLKGRPFGEIAPTDREGATMSDHCGVYQAPASGSRDAGRKYHQVLIEQHRAGFNSQN